MPGVAGWAKCRSLASLRQGRRDDRVACRGASDWEGEGDFKEISPVNASGMKKMSTPRGGLRMSEAAGNREVKQGDFGRISLNDGLNLADAVGLRFFACLPQAGFAQNDRIAPLGGRFLREPRLVPLDL